MPSTRPVCLFCRHLTAPRHVSSFQLSPWGTTRSITQMQKRRQPSRMALSPKVAQTTVKSKSKDKKKTPASSRNSPFGGMNIQTMKDAKVPHARVPRPRSEAEVKRSTRGKTFEPKGDREREKKGNDDTFHALKMQRSLANVSYGVRNSVKARISEVDTFADFALLPGLLEALPTALKSTGELAPSPIQRLAIPELLGQRTKKRKSDVPGPEQFLLAAETGSGKTLAYTLPIIDAFKRAEILEREKQAANQRSETERENSPYYVEAPAIHNASSPHSSTGRPKVLILVPTAELVDQVTRLVKTLSHAVKFKAAAISASYSPEVIQNRLFSRNGVDVVISTPQLLASIAQSEPNILSRVTHLVVDEADSLMDRSFSPVTSGIIERATPSLKQLVMCSATIPKSLDNYLRDRYPDMRRLTTPNLHAIPRRVQLGVVDVVKDPYRGNKDLACADTIYSIGRSNSGVSPEVTNDPYATKSILVFVNEREKTEQLAEYLQSKGIEAYALHRDIGEKKRNETLSLFTTQPLRPEGFQASQHQKVSWSATSKRKLETARVLVTTDLGSRGIDTLAVRNVILYDVPHSTIDFIHRLGRTGRMGRRGRGVVLVDKDDRKDVVREVREGMFRGQALI